MTGNTREIEQSVHTDLRDTMHPARSRPSARRPASSPGSTRARRNAGKIGGIELSTAGS
ncbi:MAG: hypothetical protein ABR616_09115 [Dermatophilaceae bacterium]